MKRRQFLNGTLAALVVDSIAGTANVSRAQSKWPAKIGKAGGPPYPSPPVLTAIRDLKVILKTLAVEQKASKQKRGYAAMLRAYPENQITAVHVLYHKLRQTKRPHLKDEVSWFNVKGKTAIKRQKYLNDVFASLVEAHPEAVQIILSQTSDGLRLSVPPVAKTGPAPAADGEDQ